MNRDLQLRDLRLAVQAMKMVVSFMGLLFDQYCADYEIPEDAKVAHLVGLVDASIFVNEVMEPLKPTVAKE